MLIPVDKLEAPFKALGRAVSSLVTPQAAPQQTPTAQTEKVPVDKLQPATSWYNLASAYYDQAAKEAEEKQKRDIAAEGQQGELNKQRLATGAQDLKKGEQDIATGDYTAKMRDQLDKAYADYEKAAPDQKEAARQNLIAIESVAFHRLPTTRAESMPPMIKEILAEHRMDPETPPAQYTKEVIDDIEKATGLPFKKFQEQLQMDAARRAKEQAQQENWRFNREKAKASTQGKMLKTFTDSLSSADKLAKADAGQMPRSTLTDPTQDHEFQTAYNAWRDRYNSALKRRAHEQYDSIRAQFPNFGLAPLGEGEAADSMAYDSMISDIRAIRVGQYAGSMVPVQTESPVITGAEGAAQQNDWYNQPGQQP